MRMGMFMRACVSEAKMEGGGARQDPWACEWRRSTEASARVLRVADPRIAHTSPTDETGGAVEG